MKLSTKGEYGLLALVDLARHQDSGPVQVQQIAERQGISKQYLDQLMLLMKKAGFVTSARGRLGGYALARSAESITLLEVVTALEGPVENVNFLAARTRRRNSARTALKDVWQTLNDHSRSFLEANTLAQVCERCYAAEGQVMYEI
jgi:Rrf2 family cysteine metabolism transcriptional repressor